MSNTPDTLTPFGRAVLEIAAQHGLDRAGLWRKLNNDGLKLSSQLYRKYLYGEIKTAINSDFPKAISRSLDLTDEQQRLLAHWYMLGQKHA